MGLVKSWWWICLAQTKTKVNEDNPTKLRKYNIHVEIKYTYTHSCSRTIFRDGGMTVLSLIIYTFGPSFWVYMLFPIVKYDKPLKLGVQNLYPPNLEPDFVILYLVDVKNELLEIYLFVFKRHSFRNIRMRSTTRCADLVCEHNTW